MLFFWVFNVFKHHFLDSIKKNVPDPNTLPRNQATFGTFSCVGQVLSKCPNTSGHVADIMQNCSRGVAAGVPTRHALLCQSVNVTCRTDE